MRRLSWTIFVVVVVLVLFDGCWCNEDQTVEVEEAVMKKSEKEALFLAIQGFVGSWWNGSDLYPDPCGWTPIQGISCDLVDGFWYVTDLNIGPIHDNSLTCAPNPEFRPPMFELKHLKSLSFYNCFTSNHLISLPTHNWDKFATSLESLEFRSNPSLIGPMPSVFGVLQKLNSLVLIENGFTGNVPLDVGSLRHLKRLVLSGNGFTGQIPDNLGNLSELLILDLSRNALSGCIPSSVGYLRSLLKLDLSNNMLVGSIPNELGNLKNLTLLDLRSNNLSGGLTRSLQEMDSLQELVLSSNKIWGDIRNVDWQKMQNLMILDLNNVSLSGEVPQSLAMLKKLRYVGLGNNNLTGSLPSELANMPCVSAIYVNGNNLTGELQFSESFYAKLGRRFGAWNNPNLCYKAELLSNGHTPIGVDSCKSEKFSGVPVLESESGEEFGKLQQQLVWEPSLAESNSSVGLSRHGVEEFWWVLLVESLLLVLSWNFFI